MSMTVENLVGLHVTDDAAYQKYREGMLPILAKYGGSFRYDFRVGETLHAETPEPINRLFVICFPDQKAKEEFFSNTEYLAVRKQFFEPAVAAVTILADYER